MNIKIIASVLAILMLIFLLFGFRYEYRSAGEGGLYKIDRVSGKIWLIRGGYVMSVGPKPQENTYDAPSAPSAPPGLPADDGNDD